MKNALLGYTYQQHVAFLLLAKMDVEREIEKITLEANVKHQFDDIAIEFGTTNYYLQIKDFKEVNVNSLVVDDGSIFIGGTLHKLSPAVNIIFFKQINYIPNAEILGFPAFEFSGVYIVSLSREGIERALEKLYRKDPHRRAIMERFLATQMDQRTLEFVKFKLPMINVYSTRLQERTVKISRRLLKFKDILFIEGKPGIGKSHLVAALQDQFKNNIIYRFWVSNQDSVYEDRLKYINFLTDLSKKIFRDYKDHNEAEIFAMLAQHPTTLIIDGLDHVENYNPRDLSKFIDFVNRLQTHCKVIVLSRPLQTNIVWKKQLLTNWNEKQTRKVLADLYHIDNYGISGEIYEVTSGYPILVSYIAQQYKKDGLIPVSEKFESINSYYENLLQNEKGKHALAVFLCSRGFLMRSELKYFLSEDALAFVEEFIDEHPYLFELRLNRIALFHDSLITFLRKSGIKYADVQENFNGVVYKSLINGETRFQSRISHYDLPISDLRSLIKWYSSIRNFKSMITGVIDFEAVREFYQQLRNVLSLLSPTDLEISEYYDLTLIINLTGRDHVSTSHEFQYTYVQALIFNDYTEEDITSSKYLFAMWYYMETKDASLLINASSDDMYDTDNFNFRLERDLENERYFFEFQAEPFAARTIKRAIEDTSSLEFSKNLEYILVNLYIHDTNRVAFKAFFEAIELYLNVGKEQGIKALRKAIVNKSVDYHRAWFILENARKRIVALGIDPANNDYLLMTLNQYLKKHGKKGSFTLWPELHSYLRLSLHQKRKIDIGSISAFWTKFYQRKDYTLFALDWILTVFENKGWLSWQSSVKLITEIQEVAEKGYRDLLARYIMAHNPSFIHLLLGEFPLNELRISWFDLSSDYLNELPEHIFKSELSELLQHNFGDNISIDKCRNILTSDRYPLLKKYLETYYCELRVTAGDRSIPLLIKYAIPFTEYKDSNDDYRRETVEQRFEQGIVDMKSTGLIKEKKLTPAQIAATADSDYTALANPDIFLQFPKSRIKKDFKQILYNSITGKSRYSDYHHVLWVMPGSVLKIMYDNQIPIKKAVFNSFKSYLDLSLIKLTE